MKRSFIQIWSSEIEKPQEMTMTHLIHSDIQWNWSQWCCHTTMFQWMNTLVYKFDLRARVFKLSKMPNKRNDDKIRCFSIINGFVWFDEPFKYIHIHVDTHVYRYIRLEENLIKEFEFNESEKKKNKRRNQGNEQWN